MTDYTLSVVQLCPDQYKDVANAVAESKGYGPNNLSVKLLKETDSSIWWGCHAYWIPSVFEEQMVIPTVSEETPQYVVDALSAIITSAKDGYSGYVHWMETLALNGMIIFQEEV